MTDSARITAWSNASFSSSLPTTVTSVSPCSPSQPHWHGALKPLYLYAPSSRPSTTGVTPNSVEITADSVPYSVRAREPTARRTVSSSISSALPRPKAMTNFPSTTTRVISPAVPFAPTVSSASSAPVGASEVTGTSTFESSEVTGSKRAAVLLGADVEKLRETESPRTGSSDSGTEKVMSTCAFLKIIEHRQGYLE